jgi:hypothetical protein
MSSRVIIAGLLFGLGLQGTCAQADPWTLGAGIGRYQYSEPQLGVHQSAWLPSLEASGPLLTVLEGAVTARVQVTSGQVDYNGSGRMNNQDLQALEVEIKSPDWWAIWGWDIQILGGYRQLSNDGRGLTSTGHIGYRRSSEYLYSGLSLSKNLPHGVTLTADALPLFVGRQTTHMSDIGGEFNGIAAVRNLQKYGLGGRLQICKTFHPFDLCSGLRYWWVGNSDTRLVMTSQSQYLATEPRNNTQTIDVHIKYRWE